MLLYEFQDNLSSVKVEVKVKVKVKVVECTVTAQWKSAVIE